MFLKISTLPNRRIADTDSLVLLLNENPNTWMEETDSGYKDYLARIHLLRKKAGLNQTQMGRILGISQPNYANIETGSHSQVIVNQMIYCFGIATPIYVLNNLIVLLSGFAFSGLCAILP